MKFKLSAGAEIDVLTREELRQEVEPLRQALADLRRAPTRRKLEAQGSSGGGTTAVIDFGTPGDRWEWDVRMVSGSGQDPLANVAAATVRGYQGEQGRPFDLVDRDAGGAVLVPFLSTWGEGQLVVPQNQHLLYVVTGLANNVVLLLSAYVYIKPLGTTDVGQNGGGQRGHKP